VCLTEETRRGHYMSSETNFQHSDPRMKLSIREAKIMNSFGGFSHQEVRFVCVCVCLCVYVCIYVCMCVWRTVHLR
jgi:hypothetical protein